MLAISMRIVSSAVWGGHYISRNGTPAPMAHLVFMECHPIFYKFLKMIPVFL
jgi:hypothetical protein